MANTDVSISGIVEANTKFGYDTYNWINGGQKKDTAQAPTNILVCPLSVETILGLVYMGACGETADAMSKTLRFPNDKCVVSDGFLKLTEQLNSTDVVIKTANKVFVRSDVRLAAEFQRIATEHFKADVECVDFRECDKALQIINDWVAGRTENKIPRILEGVEPDTVSVLVNAVYFNGKWLNPFKACTEPMQFNITPDTCVDVPALQRKGMYKYYEDEYVQVVEIPYQGEDYSLIIALPRDMNQLADVETRLPLDLTKLSKCEVDVTIPKFKIESTIDFTRVLKELGMSIAFESEADFSGLIEPGTGPICISQVIQKCFIDVNEEGTEAAAATAVKCRRRRCVDPAACFLADHPFHFALVNVHLQCPIFIGDCYQPIS